MKHLRIYTLLVTFIGHAAWVSIAHGQEREPALVLDRSEKVPIIELEGADAEALKKLISSADFTQDMPLGNEKRIVCVRLKLGKDEYKCCAIPGKIVCNPVSR